MYWDAGLLAMYVAFSLLLALMSSRAGRSQAHVHYVPLNTPEKSQSPPVSMLSQHPLYVMGGSCRC